MLKILVSWLHWRARRARKPTILPQGVRTLAAVELTRLGDFISILSALRALREHFPASHIHVVTNIAHVPLLALCEGGIETIGVRRANSVIGLLDALRSLRRSKPELVFSMSPSNRNAALALASGAPFIAGYLRPAESMTPFLDVTPVESIGLSDTPRLTFSSESIHDRAWKVLETLGIHRLQDPPGLFRLWKPAPAVLERLRSIGVRKPYIVVHPFSGWEFRSWPLGEFAVLAEKILDKTEREVVFVCRSVEAAQLEPLQLHLEGRRGAHFFPSGDILDTAALIRDADLFIGNDSGPLHLAALLGVPVIGLFGPASPEHTAPRNAAGTFLYHKVSCSPCTQTRCTMPANSCMRRITVDEVSDAAMRLLGPSRTNAVASYG